MPTVNLHDQTQSDTTEIDEIRPNGVLSSELEPSEALGSEPFPQLPLLGGRLRAQPPAAISRRFFLRIHESHALQGALNTRSETKRRPS
jgi:hypothetical protein